MIAAGERFSQHYRCIGAFEAMIVTVLSECRYRIRPRLGRGSVDFRAQELGPPGSYHLAFRKLATLNSPSPLFPPAAAFWFSISFAQQ